jgi:hypothetical protein
MMSSSISSCCSTCSPRLFISLVSLFPFLCNALSTQSGGSKIPAHGPHVGYTRPRPNVEFIVIGTSHFECKSAHEVTSLIEKERPDGVVIELDPERVIRLTKQDAMSEEKEFFGADFLAAINTAKRMDIPLFLGDEPTQETQQRFLEKMLLAESYSPKNFLESLFLLRKSDENEWAYIDLFQTFANDPGKLLPIAGTTFVPFVLLLGSLPSYEFGNGVSNVTTALSLIASFFAICKVFNSVIVDRDDLLAARAAKAAHVLTTLKRKETVRMQWTFDVDDDYTKPATYLQPPSLHRIPIFTLKNPLEMGMTRNLNLFEPRWLKMMDALTYDSTDAAPQPVFGCVSCTNKFYSVVQTVDGNEGRYADLIFERKGVLAQIVDEVVEGTRPSGARKVGVKIVGGDSFLIQNEKEEFSICEDGYLVASKAMLENRNTDKEGETADSAQGSDSSETVKVVVVVGLLHANGVIQRLSQLV